MQWKGRGSARGSAREVEDGRLEEHLGSTEILSKMGKG